MFSHTIHILTTSYINSKYPPSGQAVVKDKLPYQNIWIVLWCAWDRCIVWKRENDGENILALPLLPWKTFDVKQTWKFIFRFGISVLAGLLELRSRGRVVWSCCTKAMSVVNNTKGIWISLGSIWFLSVHIYLQEEGWLMEATWR